MSGYSQQQLRPVYNYTLPDDFYRHQPYNRSNVPRNLYHNGENIPRTFTIDPQQLMVSSPTSPPTEDYAFPTPQSPVSYGPRIEERSPTAYPTSKSRKRTVQTSVYPDQYQMSSYASERSSAHQTSQGAMCFTSELPTPPLSPSSTIPASGTNRCSSATSRRSSNTMNLPYSTETSTSNRGAINKLSLAASSSSQRYFCVHPGCVDSATGRPTRSFSRRADLQRHHACAHETSALFSCPRPNCIRKGDNGFTRQDHLIEHRRGYHGENIPKRGSRSSTRTKSPKR